MDLSRLYTAGAHVQHEDVLGLYIGEEARGTAQDTSQYGYVLKDTLGEGGMGQTSKGECIQHFPLFTRMTPRTHWKQDVCALSCCQ